MSLDDEASTRTFSDSSKAGPGNWSWNQSPDVNKNDLQVTTIIGKNGVLVKRQATWLPVNLNKGERADPSRIMAYAEADPKADMQNVIFYMSRFFSIQNATK